MPIIRKIMRIGTSCLLTIPPPIRRQLNVMVGDYLVWIVDKDNRVIVEKLTAKEHPGFFIGGHNWNKDEK